MEQKEQKQRVLSRLLAERRHRLPRPARQFLESLLPDSPLLDRMWFCAQDERGRVRNSVMITTVDTCCWAVMLGNDPDVGAPQTRARLALEGLDLSPGQVLDRLREVPVWFLAIDDDLTAITPGVAPQVEYTLHRLARLKGSRLRFTALLDQIDAALDDGDRTAYERLQSLLAQVTESDR